MRPQPQRMVLEEATIDRIEAMPSPTKTLMLPIYLVASFWPWWLTLLVPTFIASRVWPSFWLTVATLAFLGLTTGGWTIKQLIERMMMRTAHAAPSPGAP